jgi:hypothetical protein
MDLVRVEPALLKTAIPNEVELTGVIVKVT